MIPTLETRIEELKRLAERAQPGPWTLGYKDGSGKYDEELCKFALVDKDDRCVVHAKLCDSEYEAKFIAASNPDFILKLIAVYERQREALRNIAEIDNETCEPLQWTSRQYALGALDFDPFEREDA